MKTKINKVSALIALSLVLITLTSFAVSSLPTITRANAYTATDGYTGLEDPENPDDFEGSVAAMNKYKAWCIYKGMGMDDNQAVAAIACMQAECTSLFRSDCVEGPDILGLCPLEDSMENYEAYTAAYSSMMDTNADFRTDVTDEIMRHYGISEDTIEKCHDGDFSGDSYSSVVGTSLSLSTYYDEHGVGWVGCGLYQFTGGSLKKLFAWSEETGMRWFEFENQFAYIIAPSSDGGYKGEALQDWIAATEGKSLDECVETFFHTMINGNELPDFVAARQAIAADLYPLFCGLDWNEKYAKKVLSMAGLSLIQVREGIQDRGIIYSFASTVAYYPRNGGFIVNRTLNDDLRDRNEEVWTGYINNLKGAGDSSSKYSLFELYGEDLHWYRYMGEATYTPTLIDHVWSAIDQNKVKDLISFNTIDYDAYNYLSCNVYPNRPLVLTKDDVHNGDKDPRVSHLNIGWFDGFFYVSGSFKFEIAKWFVSIVAILMGPEIRQVFVDLLEYLESTDVWKVMKIPILGILGLAMIFFIFSLAGKAIKYAKGQGAARDAINRFLVGFICLGMMFAAIARPAVFNNVISKAVTIIDTIFNEALTASLSDDEVICVSDPDLAVHAVMWRKAVFNPWCRGQFDNMEYEHLYTHYSGKSEDEMMPQDNEEIDTTDMTGKAFYNSVEATGDVFVPVGGGTELRNWAAYAYSCGTIYHIDSTLDEEAVEDVNTDLGIRFPHWTTKTTANNPDLPADLFRIIDAQMNISPQYYANGSINNNYLHAHMLKTHFDLQSYVALFNAGLLLFMFPVIIKKLTSFFLLMITTFKMIYFSILEIFKPDMGIAPFFDSIKKSFVDYFTAAMKLNIMITLYYIFVDKGFIELVLYILCCIVVLGFSWKDVRHLYQDTKASIQRAKNRL